jgi:hypothetical protein
MDWRVLAPVLFPVQSNLFKVQVIGVEPRVMRNVPQQRCVLQKIQKLGVCWCRWDLQSTVSDWDTSAEKSTQESLDGYIVCAIGS